MKNSEKIYEYYGKIIERALNTLNKNKKGLWCENIDDFQKAIQIIKGKIIIKTIYLSEYKKVNADKKKLNKFLKEILNVLHIPKSDIENIIKINGKKIK